MNSSKHLNSIVQTSIAIRGNADDTKDEVLFNELSKLWQNHHSRGLKLRHLTGTRLNDRFGPPTERQAYGKATSQQLSEKLGVAESDLSRMRWFAHHFGSVQELKEKHPTVTNWTKVKMLIAQLRQPQVPAASAPSNEKKLVAARPVAPVIDAVRAVQAQAVKVGKLTPNGEDWKVLNEAMDAMLKSVGACLGLNFNSAPIAEPDVHSPSMLMYPKAEPTLMEIQIHGQVGSEQGAQVVAG